MKHKMTTIHGDLHMRALMICEHANYYVGSMSNTAFVRLYR